MEGYLSIGSRMLWKKEELNLYHKRSPYQK
jgi:hypothetical protein